jgi:hypothetical protein
VAARSFSIQGYRRQVYHFCLSSRAVPPVQTPILLHTRTLLICRLIYSRHWIAFALLLKKVSLDRGACGGRLSFRCFYAMCCARTICESQHVGQGLLALWEITSRHDVSLNLGHYMCVDAALVEFSMQILLLLSIFVVCDSLISHSF